MAVTQIVLNNTSVAQAGSVQITGTFVGGTASDVYWSTSSAGRTTPAPAGGSTTNGLISTTGMYTPPTNAQVGVNAYKVWAVSKADPEVYDYAWIDITAGATDTTAPTIDQFTIPITIDATEVPINALSAIIPLGLGAVDNVGVTGFYLSESSTTPTLDAVWLAVAPDVFTVGGLGLRTIYAWARDAAGNISLPVSRKVTVTAPAHIAPTVTTFVIPAAYDKLTVPITSLIASDNVAVTGYLVSESAVTPALTDTGWTSVPPTSYTVQNEGTHTLYAYVKDGGGLTGQSEPQTVYVSIPTVLSFSTTAKYNGISSLPVVTTIILEKQPALGPVVVIAPSNTVIQPSSTQQFQAVVIGDDDQRVTWYVQGGNANGAISTSGMYTAPGRSGVYSIMAVSVANAAIRGSVPIIVSNSRSQEFGLIGLSQVGDNTFRIRYSHIPYAEDANAARDALNKYNYSVIGPNDVSVSQVIPIYERDFDLVLNKALVTGIYTVSVQSVQRPNNIDLNGVTDLSIYLVINSPLPAAPPSPPEIPLITLEEAKAVIKEHFSPAMKGTEWDALLESLATGDRDNWENARLAFEQLFKSTASGPWLDKLASEDGLVRPSSVGLNDARFRKLAIAVDEKVTALAIWKLLEVFYGIDATRSNVTSALSEPYTLEHGTSFNILVDEQKEVYVYIDGNDFIDVNNATALELSAVITAALRAAGERAFAAPYESPVNNHKYVRIYSGSYGQEGAIRVTGGDAQINVQFPDFIMTGTDNLVWIFSKEGQNCKITEESPSTLMKDVRIGDYVVISHISQAALANCGTFEITDVFYDPLHNTASYVVFENSAAVAEPVTQGPYGVSFFRPTRSVYPKVCVAQHSTNAMTITLPVTTEAVGRTLKKAAYIKQTTELNPVAGDAPISLNVLTITTKTAHGLSAGQWVILDGFYNYATFASRINGTYQVVAVPSSTQFTIRLNINPVPLRRKLTYLELQTVGGGYSICPYGAEGIFLHGHLVAVVECNDYRTYVYTIDDTYTITMRQLDYDELSEYDGGYGYIPYGATIAWEVAVNNEPVAIISNNDWTYVFDTDWLDYNGSMFLNGTETITVVHAPVVANVPGPYLLNPYGGLVHHNKAHPGMSITGIEATLTDAIDADRGYRSLNISDASQFPDEPGWLAFNIGLENEVGPVPYLGRISPTALLLDYGYRFSHDLETGTSVTLLSGKGPFNPANPEDIGCNYITASNMGRVVAQDMTRENVAAGFDLNFKILYPSDRGLGNEGGGDNGQKPSDIIGVYGRDDLDQEYKDARE